MGCFGLLLYFNGKKEFLPKFAKFDLGLNISSEAGSDLRFGICDSNYMRHHNIYNVVLFGLFLLETELPPQPKMKTTRSGGM